MWELNRTPSTQESRALTTVEPVAGSHKFTKSQPPQCVGFSSYLQDLTRISSQIPELTQLTKGPYHHKKETKITHGTRKERNSGSDSTPSDNNTLCRVNEVTFK